MIAPVVRAEKPTSAKVGAKATITEDGALSGWIGGSCAEPTVRREAKKALPDGQPRFIRLCPPEKLGAAVFLSNISLFQNSLKPYPICSDFAFSE